jgi:hypothetical protein
MLIVGEVMGASHEDGAGPDPHQQARAAGMNQIVALPVIGNALLKTVLAWYL